MREPSAGEQASNVDILEVEILKVKTIFLSLLNINIQNNQTRSGGTSEKGKLVKLNCTV